MKLGMIGLGRMGGNMAERLRRHGHTVVGMDPGKPEAAQDLMRGHRSWQDPWLPDGGPSQ